MRSTSCIVRCTLRARTPHAFTNAAGRLRRLKATVPPIEIRLIARSSSSRKTLDGAATAHGCEIGGCVVKRRQSHRRIQQNTDALRQTLAMATWVQFLAFVQQIAIS